MNLVPYSVSCCISIFFIRVHPSVVNDPVSDEP